MASAKRSVRLCEGVAPATGRTTGPVALWAFGVGGLAKLLGISEGAVRTRIHRGTLDPMNLESLCRAWAVTQGLVPKPLRKRKAAGTPPLAPSSPPEL